MLLSLEWLNEFVNTDGIEPKAYCDRMTDTGSKVEGFETLGEDIKNVVVGRIEKITRHPNADKLQICMLNVGKDELVQIVTGAQNVFEGALVLAALAPAELPGGVKIKAGKLRGEASNGMLCSIAELGLTTHDMPGAIEDGILILSEPCEIGMDIRDALKLRDTVVEFEITPNRPDCLSVIGLARESAASFTRELRLHTPVVKGGCGNAADYISVEVRNDALCPRYTARVVRNVKIAPSPLWMRARLRAMGVRPINNIVDITNYVMLEYGQPMHAFDYACLDGSHIIVREATEGECFKSLDDVDHTLRAGMLVIADENKPVALAGVMGGANSEIKDSTVTVVFESANFMGSSVRTTSRSLGMRTESSGRFEKGLDPENTMAALDRACELVELLGAGEVCDGVIDVYGGKKAPTVLPLDADRINRFLGVSLTCEYMEDILRTLGFGVADGKVFVPSYRADVECMQDLAEEVLRIYGYNTIKATPFVAGVKPGCLTAKRRFEQKLKGALCSIGYSEICTFSFISPRYYDKINMPADDSRRNSVVIKNPLGEDTSVMRTTLTPSMLEVLAHNDAHHDDGAALYEIARVYIPSEEKTQLPAEPRRIAVGMYGNGDFYAMKGVCETLLSEAGIRGATYRACASNSLFHPGRCAELYAEGRPLGVMGELHPDVAENYGFDCRVYLADLDFEALFALSSTERHYTALPKYPAVTRDFAFVCDEALEVGAIEDVMTRAGGKLVVGIKLFDVYRGAQIPEGKKSVALNVALRADDRTLTDEEADKCAKKILAAVESELGLKLRA